MSHPPRRRMQLVLFVVAAVISASYFVLTPGDSSDVVLISHTHTNHDDHSQPHLVPALVNAGTARPKFDPDDGEYTQSPNSGPDLQRSVGGAMAKATNLVWHRSSHSTEGDEPKCGPRYSSFECIDAGAATFRGEAAQYGFPIVNRSCRYSNVMYDGSTQQFIFFAPESLRGKLKLLPVSLASRPYDLPLRHYKRVVLKRKIGGYYDWTPTVRFGAIPCDASRDKRVLAYYTPIVAPWNYAHTLFCDLFGIFWQMYEFGIKMNDIQVVAASRHYRSEFPLPNSNKAFEVFSRRPAIYDAALPTAVFPTLLAGMGTKSWSWVTDEYSASGSPDLWMAFRQHIIDVAGATDRTPRFRAGTGADAFQASSRKVRVSFCHKKDTRGVGNYDEAIQFLRRHYAGDNVEFVLESGVGKSAREQVQMMIDADVYMCNEGTLATNLFLMPPGSVFLSLPLVYHTPHLHQRNAGSPKNWWRLPDTLRPDPRKNVGGNIDWFPPAIRWVHSMWYDQIPMNETQIVLPLVNLRNYMPNYNLILQEHRLVQLMDKALSFVRGAVRPLAVEEWVLQRRGGDSQPQLPWSLDDQNFIVYPPKDVSLVEHYRNVSVGEVDATPPPGYSINANLCRQLLQLTPELTRSFNTARCYFGMSWLCEFYTNTKYRWRLLHEKWSLSRGRCGSIKSSVQHMRLHDPRETQRSMSEYLFYTRDELAKAYTTTDLGSLAATEEELSEVFPVRSG